MERMRHDRVLLHNETLMDFGICSMQQSHVNKKEDGHQVADARVWCSVIGVMPVVVCQTTITMKSEYSLL